jgi:hypothetical protein
LQSFCRGSLPLALACTAPRHGTYCSVGCRCTTGGTGCAKRAPSLCSARRTSHSLEPPPAQLRPLAMGATAWQCSHCKLLCRPRHCSDRPDTGTERKHYCGTGKAAAHAAVPTHLGTHWAIDGHPRRPCLQLTRLPPARLPAGSGQGHSCSGRPRGGAHQASAEFCLAEFLFARRNSQVILAGEFHGGRPLKFIHSDGLA